jgi:hypothetical protein
MSYIQLWQPAWSSELLSRNYFSLRWLMFPSLSVVGIQSFPIKEDCLYSKSLWFILCKSFHPFS